MAEQDRETPRGRRQQTPGRRRANRPGRFVYEDELPRGRKLLSQLRWLAIAAVAVVGIGFGAGWLFGNTNSAGAARSVLGPKVVTEPEVMPTATPTDLPGDFAVAPTSGTASADPLCGYNPKPVETEVQVATIMEGGVVVQYEPGSLPSDGRERLRAFVEDYASHVLVAPNPRLSDPVVATAFRSRMRLQELDVDVLTTFVTGYARPQGDPERCPT